MSDEKKKSRTLLDVRIDIENLERARDRAIAAAQVAQAKTDRDARIKATAAVGKIDREYIQPAMKEARKLRDATHVLAKSIRDVAVGAAHGAYERAMREADAAYEVARESIDATALAQIRPHEEVLKNVQADADSALHAEVVEAKRVCARKVAPLLDEAKKMEAEKKVIESEIPLESPVKTKAKQLDGLVKRTAKGVEA